MINKYDSRFKEILQNLESFLSFPNNTPHFADVKVKIRNALIFHSKLTFKELNKVTSIPHGTLYEKLMEMIKKGSIQRNTIPNSRKFSYRIHEKADFLGFTVSKEKDIERENRIEKIFSFLSDLYPQIDVSVPSNKLFLNQIKEYAFWRVFQKYYHRLRLDLSFPEMSKRELNLIKSLEYEYDSKTITYPLDMVNFSPLIRKFEERFITSIVIPGYEKEIPNNMQQAFVWFYTRKILSFPRLLRLTKFSKSSLFQALKALSNTSTIHKISGKNSQNGRPLYYVPSLPKKLIEVTEERATYLLSQLNEFRSNKLSFLKNQHKLSQFAGYEKLYIILDSLYEEYYPYWEKIREYCEYLRPLLQ